MAVLLLLSAFLPASLACTNMNVGAYKLHNGNGEMSYMDRDKNALYSEQGVWMSWKVPVPRHWDPKTGKIRTDSPGKALGKNWSHWNQQTDDNPPTGTMSPEKMKDKVGRINAPDPYREYLRKRQRRPYNPALDDDLYFLSAGHSHEHGTSLEIGVIKAQRPRMPVSYLGALQRPIYTAGKEDAARKEAPRKRPTFPAGVVTTQDPEWPVVRPDYGIEVVDAKGEYMVTLEPGLIMEQAGSGFSAEVGGRSAERKSSKLITFD